MADKRYIFGLEAQKKDGAARAAEAARNPSSGTGTRKVDRPAQGFNGPTPPGKMVQWARGANDGS